MSSSELSELTERSSSDSEEEIQPKKKGTLDYHFNKTSKTAQPPKLKKKRPPSPPHEYVLADREEVAVSDIELKYARANALVLL